MNKKLLKELIDNSFDATTIIEERVLEIIKRLKRSELKQYLKGLKKRVRELTVFVESPFLLSNEQICEIKNFFPGKQIVFSRKSSLLLGIRIINNDIINDFTLKNRLEKLIDHINT